MKKINCIKMLFLALTFMFASNAIGSQVTYKIGAYTFDVPKAYIPDLSPWSWFKSLVGLDEDVESFIFQFSGKSVSSAVNGYVSEDGSVEQKVIGAIYLINRKERERLSDPNELADLWYAKSSYEEREVVFDEDTGYYFVYEKKGYRGMFYIFSRPPESDLPSSKEDFFVAACSGGSLTELKHVSCSRQFLFRPDLMIDFSVSLENLKVQPQVMSFLQKRFSGWIKPEVKNRRETTEGKQ